MRRNVQASCAVRCPPLIVGVGITRRGGSIEGGSRMKRKYEAPTVKVVGAVRDLTFGSSDGESTDAVFPINTKRSQLTFSG
jgi:hypothetical protein